MKKNNKTVMFLNKKITVKKVRKIQKAVTLLNTINAIEKMPDNRDWTNRFQIRSATSGNLYTIAQNKKKRFWGCDCPSWIYRGRNCKHLQAMGLPGHCVPFEPNVEMIKG